jgi:LysR family transcriptional regulator (chromosome initiation inhibitor)
MPIDSAQLAAFAAVIREGSFERAARTLNLTRSAVSQRVKQLEERVGRVLIRRGAPCTPTDVGQTLFRHAHQMSQLEDEALASLRGTGAAGATLAIAVNADSLATWFIDALAPLARERGLAFDVLIEDQDHSSDLLRQGRVMAAVTSDPHAVQGCRVVRLGVMRYRAVATPAFVRKYFPKGVDPAALAVAPVMVFNRKDALQARFARRFTRRAMRAPVHGIPSSQAFLDAALAGMGWGMNPEVLVQPHLAAGALIDLAPREPIEVVLYWQHWRLQIAALKCLTDSVLQVAHLALHAGA